MILHNKGHSAASNHEKQYGLFKQLVGTAPVHMHQRLVTNPGPKKKASHITFLDSKRIPPNGKACSVQFSSYENVGTF
jgi:hypothetical protein